MNMHLLNILPQKNIYYLKRQYKVRIPLTVSALSAAKIFKRTTRKKREQMRYRILLPWKNKTAA